MEPVLHDDGHRGAQDHGQDGAAHQPTLTGAVDPGAQNEADNLEVMSKD